MITFTLQDMLLRCLRKLEKYEAYCLAWSEFVKNAKPQRTADLMTQHAEFKIHITEVAAARRMLREAVILDKKNIGARDLLQVYLFRVVILILNNHHFASSLAGDLRYRSHNAWVRYNMVHKRLLRQGVNDHRQRYGLRSL